MTQSLLNLSSGTLTLAILGSIVQKGKFSAGTYNFDKRLKVVDFPTLGKPTIPIFKVFPGLVMDK